MIIASRLTDGRVVFMAENDAWVERIADGVLIHSSEEAPRLMSRAERAAAENVVVDPYFIDVVVEGGERRPAQVREAIRAFGPSVRTDLESAGASE